MRREPFHPEDGIGPKSITLTQTWQNTTVEDGLFIEAR